MDPLLFGIQADVVGEVLGTLILLSLLVERALAPIFEWRVFINQAANKGAKEPIAIAAATTMRDAIYGTGWDGTVRITANSNGQLQGETQQSCPNWCEY